MEKLQRNYTMTIQRAGEDEIVVGYPLTLEFSIQRANLSVAANAEFRIYNLSEAHRAAIFKNPWETSVFMKIRLDAGYGNDKNNLSTVFNGNVRWARSSRAEGAKDYITQINAYDFGFVMTNSDSTFTVEGVEASQDAVIRRLCKDLKYPVDGVQTPLPIGAIGTFDKTARTKYIAGGNTWELLKVETGSRCYIDNGKVYCLGVSEAVTGQITEISQKTGLLGTPKTDGRWIIIDMIFEPGLIVGQTVVLNSTGVGYENTQSTKNNENTYKVIGLEHRGTISGAVPGKCTTTATLMRGSADKSYPFTIF